MSTVCLQSQGRSAEPAPFSAFVVEGKAILFPIKDFDLVLALVAEDEEGSLERIQLERSLDHSSHPIDGLSHVDGEARKIDRSLNRKSADGHKAFKVRRTSRSWSPVGLWFLGSDWSLFPFLMNTKFALEEHFFGFQSSIQGAGNLMLRIIKL